MRASLRHAIVLWALWLPLSAVATDDWAEIFERSPTVARTALEVDAMLAAAEAGDVQAQARLALMYQSGIGVERSPERSASWCRRAAKQGHAGAQYHFGMLHLSGAGVPKDLGEAARWLRRASEQDEAVSLLSLRWFYLDANGMPFAVSQGGDWLRSAAQNGASFAQYALGRMPRGISQADNEARIRLLREAAEDEHAGAQFDLGLAHLFGEGVPRDPAEALRWFERAGAQRHAQALRNLGAAHALGIGAPPDQVESLKWFLLAQEAGHPLVEDNIRVQQEIVGDGGLAQAILRADEWRNAVW